MVLAACDGPGAPADGAPVDAAGMDGGVSSDPCAADTQAPAATVGCNGPIVGPEPVAGSVDAPCTDDLGCPGGGRCERDLAGRLTCAYACPPAPTYVSTGGCPSGARCFTLGRDQGRCFRDCASDADCAPLERCDLEGSCTPLELDGGPSVAPDAGPDGGATDAAPLDGALGVDAGI